MIAEIVRDTLWNYIMEGLAMVFKTMMPFVVESIVGIILLAVIAKVIYEICCFFGVSKKRARKIVEGVEVIANLKDIYSDVKKS